MKNKSIAIIIYGNPDYYPSTIDAIRILENDYRVVIFCRNIHGQSEQFSKNTALYKFGRRTSVRKSEKKSGISKLIEYVLFAARTAYYSRKNGCVSALTYDNYALTAAMISKLFNRRLKIFHHAHEIIDPEASSHRNLRYWIGKFALNSARHCVWVSQADAKRARFFAQMTGVKDVKVMRNFARRDYNYPSKGLALCERLKKDGYVIAVYTGTIGKESYIEDLAGFIRRSDVKIAVVIAGDVLDKNVESLLQNENNEEYPSKLIYLGFLHRKEMCELLASAHFGLALYTMSTLQAKTCAGACAKMGTYIAYGLPVIYPSFWDYESYYKEIGLSYRNGDELIERVKELAKDQGLRRRLGENAKRIFMEKINFESEFMRLKETIDHYMKVK